MLKGGAAFLLVEGKMISISYARSLHLTWGYLPSLLSLSVQHNTQESKPRVSSSFQVSAELRFLRRGAARQGSSWGDAAACTYASLELTHKRFPF